MHLHSFKMKDGLFLEVGTECGYLRLRECTNKCDTYKLALPFPGSIRIPNVREAVWESISYQSGNIRTDNDRTCRVVYPSYEHERVAFRS